jgi:hypothetical protein
MKIDDQCNNCNVITEPSETVINKHKECAPCNIFYNCLCSKVHKMTSEPVFKYLRRLNEVQDIKITFDNPLDGFLS